MSESKKQQRLKALLHYLIAAFCALLVSFLITEWFHPIVVSGQSMEPTLQSGNIMISTDSFTSKDLEVGDIVVFKENNTQLIKRIVATAGDEIWIEDGILYVNGEASPYQYEKIQDPGILKEHIFIRKGEFFCMGDNRNHSYDCRNFGVVEFEQIKYKIIKRAFAGKEDLDEKHK